MEYDLPQYAVYDWSHETTRAGWEIGDGQLYGSYEAALAAYDEAASEFNQQEGEDYDYDTEIEDYVENSDIRNSA